MGMPPREMRAMSLWEYTCCVDGWRQAHEPGEKEDDEMTPELFRKIMDAPPIGAMH